MLKKKIENMKEKFYDKVVMLDDKDMKCMGRIGGVVFVAGAIVCYYTYKDLAKTETSKDFIRKVNWKNKED